MKLIKQISKKMKINKSLVFLMFIALVSSCINDDPSYDGDDNIPISEATIAEVLVNSPGNATNVTLALDRVDLLDNLNDKEKNFTLFMPDDDAFDEFLDENSYVDINDVPLSVLEELLLNHIVEDVEITTAMMESLGTGYFVTESGFSLFFDTTTENITFNGTSEINEDEEDVEVLNGYIHVINTVIEPATIADFIEADQSLDSFLSALTREESFDYMETFAATEGETYPLTVFAPTNSAFNDLSTELEGSLNDIPTETLEADINYHIVAGNEVLVNDLEDDMTITTLGGEITANVTGGASLTDINERISDFLVSGIFAKNGILHKIDKVLLSERV